MRIDYDEISPLTGNKCVFVEPIDDQHTVMSKICMESGYTTLNTYHDDNEHFAEIEEKFPQVSVANKFKDEFGFYWYPMMTAANYAILMPEPINAEVSENDFCWVVGTMYNPSEGAPAELDRENARTFDKSKFEDALNYFSGLVSANAQFIEEIQNG